MFSCEVCEFFTSAKGHLKFHVERIHENKYKCSSATLLEERKKKEMRI